VVDCLCRWENSTAFNITLFAVCASTLRCLEQHGSEVQLHSYLLHCWHASLKQPACNGNLLIDLLCMCPAFHNLQHAEHRLQ
jgi:hypothetical protein